MSRTYKTTGINLKSMPMGESDRLLTILTREFGLVRAVAMGARKHNSRLGGRSELFVVNELLIAKGRSLDKITQAETLESYPRLGQDLKKLIAGQYLAELCLHQALSDQPQEDLFFLLNEHLVRLERSPGSDVLAHLTHAVFQLLVLAGVAPQVHLCCVTREALPPDFGDRNWRIGFSIPAGGTVTLSTLEQLLAKPPIRQRYRAAEKAPVVTTQSETHHASLSVPITTHGDSSAHESAPAYKASPPMAGLHRRMSAPELMLLQHLAEANLPELKSLLASVGAELTQQTLNQLWQSVEQALRAYAQYYFDRPIRSAALIDACFATADLA